ncbi:hypothetical protein AB433_02415 [Croceicoccus naphthovorans]|uniref:Uncharacterized protein n=1 Tax=Croceicoccus naphthovorans TaxID=1348774 RepID=A0A0G3XLZ4_9SPHN|nr:hypothetical protein AB433_02415 [Croceicoccus naphthovorans]
MSSLEAFLSGKPAPGDTLTIDLANSLAELESTSSEAQVKNPDSPAGLQARLAQLQRQVIALPPDQLSNLLVSSGIGVTPSNAVLAAEGEMRAAAELAQQAENESERIIATERTKLYAVRAAQARFSGVLSQVEARPEQIQNDALAWRRKVKDIASTARNSTAQADSLYEQLVSYLQDVRGQLRGALSSRNVKRDTSIDPPPLDDALTQGLVAAPELIRLRHELVENAATLADRQATATSREKTALRDAMVLVNASRLELIDHLSSSKRSAVLGFGSEGIAQVSRELAQITLDLRYQASDWRNNLDEALAPFRQPTPSMVFSLFAILLLTIIFRWWRQHGISILLTTETALRRRNAPTLASAFQVTIVNYVRRVGAPLDWMVYILMLRWLLPATIHPAGLSYVWIIVIFSIGAWLIARLANELVRGGRSEDPRANLRLKSLGLVVGVALAVLLALALARESVGEGAIYHWILSFCWLLAIPVTLILSHWWRDRIVALCGVTAGRSALLGWIARDPAGILGLIGRVFAGTVLLINGARLAIARRISDFALVHELFEQRNRMVAAQRVAQDKASGKYRRLPAEKMDVLAPHRAPLQASRVNGPSIPYASEELRGGTIAAIVGERGLGKSAALQALKESHATKTERVFSIRVDARGFEGVLADLSASLTPDTRPQSEDAIVQAICKRDDPRHLFIEIDDVQRLVIPAIGGLRDLDRLVAFARCCGEGCVWVMSIGAPAWNYISRARFDRVLFDQIRHLDRWSSKDLRTLLERRSKQAEIEADFSDLAEMGGYQFDSDLTPEQRKEAAFFDRLNEYANGNPAIALEFWRRSLFIDSAAGKVVVRTFATPDIQALQRLPDAAMFVLRAILQMDHAQQSAIERSTDLPSIIVVDALRGLERIGVIARDGDGYRITMFWWAEAVRVLMRQNLIVRF